MRRTRPNAAEHAKKWLLFDFDFDGVSAPGEHGVEDRHERQYQNQFGLLGHTEYFDCTALSDYDTGATAASDLKTGCTFRTVVN